MRTKEWAASWGSGSAADRLAVVTCLIALATATTAFAQSAPELTTTRNPRAGELYSSSLLEKAMGHACLGLAPLADAMACNPALNHRATRRELSLSGQLANGYSNLQ